MTLAPGMTLFYVSRNHGQPHEVTVDRIGRKWAYLSRGYGRVDMDTLAVDGGQYSSPAQCYGSREEWEEQTERGKAWTALKLNLPWSPPDGVDTPAIKAAAELLGCKLPEEP